MEVACSRDVSCSLPDEFMPYASTATAIRYWLFGLPGFDDPKDPRSHAMPAMTFLLRPFRSHFGTGSVECSSVLSPLGFVTATMPGPKPTTAARSASAGRSAQAACGPRHAFDLLQSLGLRVGGVHAGTLAIENCSILAQVTSFAWDACVGSGSHTARSTVPEALPKHPGIGGLGADYQGPETSSGFSAAQCTLPMLRSNP